MVRVQAAAPALLLAALLYELLIKINNILIPGRRMPQQVQTKTLHFIWWQGWADAPPSIPDDARRWVQEWEQSHPDFAVHRWDEAAFFQVCVPRVEAAFSDVRDMFARLRAVVEKVDLARWLILYAFGGVYLDCDMRCMKGVSELYDECLLGDTIFLAREPGGCLNNAIICCSRPGDSAVHAVCTGLFQRILIYSSTPEWPGTLVVTGPVAITSIIGANQLLTGRFTVESGGPLVFGAGSYSASVRSAELPSDVIAGWCVAFLSSLANSLSHASLQCWGLQMQSLFTCLKIGGVVSKTIPQRLSSMRQRTRVQDLTALDLTALDLTALDHTRSA